MTPSQVQELRGRLSDLWLQVPLVERAEPGDNFFDVGGTSLTALGLLGKIKMEFGAEVALADFLADPTVEGLCAALNDGHTVSGPRFVTLREGSKPLVVVHTILGSAIGYAHLARSLGGSRGCVGFEVAMPEKGTLPVLSIPDLAHRYIELLRERYPEGPYLLAGWSFGGIVAHEMACQLAEAEVPIGPLTIFDTNMAGASDEPTAENAMRMLGLALKSNATASGAGSSERLLQDAIEAGTLAPGTPLSQIEEMLEMYELHLNSVWDHKPRALASDLLLFKAATQLEEMADPYLGWRPYCAGTIESIVVPGDHYTLLKPPHGAEVGALLTERLRELGY